MDSAAGRTPTTAGGGTSELARIHSDAGARSERKAVANANCPTSAAVPRSACSRLFAAGFQRSQSRVSADGVPLAVSADVRVDALGAVPAFFGRPCEQRFRRARPPIDWRAERELVSRPPIHSGASARGASRQLDTRHALIGPEFEGSAQS